MNPTQSRFVLFIFSSKHYRYSSFGSCINFWQIIAKYIVDTSWWPVPLNGKQLHIWQPHQNILANLSKEIVLNLRDQLQTWTKVDKNVDLWRPIYEKYGIWRADRSLCPCGPLYILQRVAIGSLLSLSLHNRTSPQTPTGRTLLLKYLYWVGYPGYCQLWVWCLRCVFNCQLKWPEHPFLVKTMHVLFPGSLEGSWN